MAMRFTFMAAGVLATGLLAATAPASAQGAGETDARSFDLAALVTDRTARSSASRAPLPQPRPADAIRAAALPRTADGIRIVGPRYFPKQTSDTE